MLLASGAALLISSVLVTLALAESPPVAKRDATVDHVFGLTIADPYRWMEGPKNAAFEDWLKAQGAVGRARLNASPYLAKWQKRLNAASATTVTNRLQHRVGKRLFYMHLEAGKQGVLTVRLEDGRETVLFDPNIVKDGAHASVTGYSVSPDGKTIAINLDRGGDEITKVEFYAVDTGAKLPDELDHIWGEFQVSWLGNDQVFYTQMAADPDSQTDKMLNMRARYHRLGSDVATDKILAAAGLNASFPLDPQEFPFLFTQPGSDWIVAGAGGARAEARFCFIRATDLLGNAPQYKCLIGYDDSIQFGDIHGSTFYMNTTRDHPNGQLISLDLSDPEVSLAKAKVVVPEDPHAVITGYAQARDALYLRRMTKGIDGFTRVTYEGAKATPVATPYPGLVALIDSDPQQDGFAYTLQGWTHPRTFYAYDPAAGTTTDLKAGARTAKDYNALVEAISTEAKSLDGTQVPITILKPKGLQPDGKALSIVMGYGAYGATTNQPAFDPMSLEWVADGHIYVIAGIRGGGELGDAWRLAGKGENKHHGIEDMVAAADALVAKGYSQPKQIALYSASAGGIIVGGAVDHFPTHFGAAIIHAGMLNPTRLASDSNGANQYSEFGDPNTEAGFKQLYAMDAYLNIKPNVAYPAVLLDVGLNDNRVAPWNSGKYGAALLVANTGANPILFRTDSDSGHFGTSLSQVAAEAADHYTFVEMELSNPKSGHGKKKR